MRTLVIRSSEWARGGNDEGTKLKMSNGTYCCLGLDARDRGIPDNYLIEITTPMRLLIAHGNLNCPGKKDYIRDWVYFEEGIAEGNGEKVIEAVRINDDPDLSDEQRIDRLRPIFASIGVEIDWRPNE